MTKASGGHNQCRLGAALRTPQWRMKRIVPSIFDAICLTTYPFQVRDQSRITRAAQLVSVCGGQKYVPLGAVHFDRMPDSEVLPDITTPHDHAKNISPLARRLVMPCRSGRGSRAGSVQGTPRWLLRTGLLVELLLDLASAFAIGTDPAALELPLLAE